MDLRPIATITVAGYVLSAANARESKSDRNARVKAQRAQAFAVVLAALRTERPVIELPLTIVVTRASPYRLDSDNLASATKAQRDGATDALRQYAKDQRRRGPRDDSDGLTWLYAQQACRGGEEHLRVEIYPAGCVAKWMLRHLPTEPTALEQWLVSHAPQLDALLVREASR